MGKIKYSFHLSSMHKTFHTSNTFTTQQTKLKEVDTIKLQENSKILPLIESAAEREMYYWRAKDSCATKNQKEMYLNIILCKLDHVAPIKSCIVKWKNRCVFYLKY